MRPVQVKSVDQAEEAGVFVDLPKFILTFQALDLAARCRPSVQDDDVLEREWRIAEGIS